MIDTKSTVQGRKHTLLHYLTELLEKKFPHLLDFHAELPNVEDGAKGRLLRLSHCSMRSLYGITDIDQIHEQSQSPKSAPA